MDVFEDQYVHKKVEMIEFGLLSPKMIKKMASAKIVTPELYDKEGYSVDGGLMDIRLGVIDPGLKCKTCGSKLKECPGHFGYIELARPVIHIKLVPLILTMLRSSCRECGRAIIVKGKAMKVLVASDEKDEVPEISAEGVVAKKKEKAVAKETITMAKGQNRCPYCKARQQKITLEKPTTFFENEKRLSPIEIRTRLEKVSDDDCTIFGLNPGAARPEWSVLTILPVPPVTMRPSITLESGERSEDDLTHKLGDIVRINQRLFENINAGAPEIIIEDLWDLLQYHITTFFDNEVAQLPPARHRSGQPLKTITERIKSKEGRIRHNLVGKRTNFSARTVISPDPMIALNEVGIPKSIAMNLTVPERVTTWNFEYLKKFVKKGPNEYAGANYVVRPDGKRKKITDETKEQLLEELQPGYTVERHLMDGDISIFNRQPSLHRMSMMCHKVKVLPGKTFRMSPAVCHPYNADFDGDEMNLHIPQTEEAREEAEVLMMVQTQLISPRYGLSVMGCIQDSISGNFLLTRKGTEISRKDAIDLLFSIGIDDFSKLPSKETVTGKEIFSVCLPNDFDFTGFSKGCKKHDECKKEKCDDDCYVVIRKGILKTGIMDRSNLGEGSGLLLRNLYTKYGQDATVKILEKLFRLGVAYLLKRGFTVSISDSDLPTDSKAEIQNILSEAEDMVQNLITTYHSGEMEIFPGRSAEETLELRILEALNKARNRCGKIVVEKTDPKSGTSIMAVSGARGNPIQLSQMAACVGQQAMRGKRISKGYSERTISAFKKKDLNPGPRGFIRNGFKHGLTPYEFFFASMTGRDSLMDTALRTPKSGYLYRRLANALQDLKVEYDNTVRDASGKIIQFSYGEDGIDVSKSENGVINVRRIIELIESKT